jgi:hypothetical protein
MSEQSNMLDSKGVHIFAAISMMVFLYAVSFNPTLLVILIGINAVMVTISLLSLCSASIRDKMAYDLARIGRRRALFTTVLHYSNVIFIWGAITLIDKGGSSIDYGMAILVVLVLRLIYSIPLIIKSWNFDIESYESKKTIWTSTHE